MTSQQICKSTRATFVFAFTFAAFCAVSGLSASAQSTAFTYQGRLTDNGAPVTGTYDLQFTIYDAGTRGSVVAGPITNSLVAVTNGLFTTTLDFGAGVFNGSDRWLEIGVATSGSGVFTNLSPRQLITSTPYAIQAANAANAAVAASANAVSAANVTGTLTTAQLPTSVLTNGASDVAISGTLSGTFSGDGLGLTNVPGTMPWQSVGATSITAAANQAYLLTNPALDTVTLPVDATVGDVVTVSGTGSNGWQVVAGSGQSIAGIPAGIDWSDNNNAPSVGWFSAASLADGTKLVAVVFGGGIYTSTNSGVTWSANNNAPTNEVWYSAASSADGTKLVAVDFQRRIWTSGPIYPGASGTTVQFQYYGNGVWQPVGQPASQIVGKLSPSQLPNVALLNTNQTFTGQNSFSTANGTVSIINGSFTPELVMTGGPAPGHLRVRDAIEVWPNSGGTTPGYLDVRNTNGVATVRLYGVRGTITCQTLEQTSDRNAKWDFTPINPTRILQKVAALPITEWQYKTGPQGVKHLGPIAQDFDAAFGLNGSDDTHIATVDEGGVALAAIQGLNQKVDEMRAELKHRGAENAELKQQLKQLTRTVNKLSQKINRGAR